MKILLQVVTSNPLNVLSEGTPLNFDSHGFKWAAIEPHHKLQSTQNCTPMTIVRALNGQH
jgi:hypothetical protein